MKLGDCIKVDIEFTQYLNLMPRYKTSLDLICYPLDFPTFTC